MHHEQPEAERHRACDHTELARWRPTPRTRLEQLLADRSTEQPARESGATESLGRARPHHGCAEKHDAARPIHRMVSEVLEDDQPSETVTQQMNFLRRKRC